MAKSYLTINHAYSVIIYTNKAKRNLFACLSGMAPCFGHAGVTLDVENDRPGPGSLRGHFEATRGCFFENEGFVLRL